MKRVNGSIEVSLLECVNPKKNKWRVRWDVQKTEEDSNSATYMEEEFDHQPTIDEIKSLIIVWYNSQIDKDVLSGMVYNGVQVWLSIENQFNYKVAYDLAIQTNGESLPVVFKFGTEDEPVYKQFNTLNELTNFYSQSITYVQNALAKGWQVKDSIDFSKYKI